MNTEDRANLYNARFPKRPPLQGVGMLTGTWMIGACYRNPNKLYGAYPHGYLERVYSMFPDARSALHVFSGGMTEAAAREHLPPACRDLELVDIKGPEDGRHPTWQGDIAEMPASWRSRFDLILADPPYSHTDAEVYGTPMVNRGAVIRALRRVAKPGANLVWLDQVWPMHRKSDWKVWGTVGLLRSTNHRVRMISFFSAV